MPLGPCTLNPRRMGPAERRYVSEASMAKLYEQTVAEAVEPEETPLPSSA